MFVITLRFADRTRAALLMDGHKSWIDRGFADGVFLLVGSLRPEGGGVILAHDASFAAIERRVRDDPFVAEGVVATDIVEVEAGRVDDRLAFLKVSA